MLIGVLLGYLVPGIPAALSSLQVGAEVGNRIDFEEGGPGKIIGYMMSRFKPQAAHTVAGTRNVFMVADLDEAQMTEMMLIASKKLDTYHEFTPVSLIGNARNGCEGDRRGEKSTIGWRPIRFKTSDPIQK